MAFMCVMPTTLMRHLCFIPRPRPRKTMCDSMSDGTNAVTRYFGVLSSHSALRPSIITSAADKSKYIPWHELLRRTFNVDVTCARCKGQLRLIALVKTQVTIIKILAAMGLFTLPPAAASAWAPPCLTVDDWTN